MEVKIPEVLKPQTRPTWKYISPETLAVSGIYSQNDLNRLRDRILFPIERNAVVNKIAMGMTGHTVNTNGMTIGNLFDQETIAKLADSAWEKMWTKFLTFGTASAGVIGIIIVSRFVKLIIDTIIHGYALYSLYGFSLHLIGAIWNSVTQLLLFLGQQEQNRVQREQNEQEQQNEEE